MSIESHFHLHAIQGDESLNVMDVEEVVPLQFSTILRLSMFDITICPALIYRQ